MSRPLILVGGGGHCKAVIDVAECAGREILGVLDKPEEVGKSVLGYNVIGTDDDMARYAKKADFLVTVGQIKSAELRVQLHRRIEAVGCRLATLVSPASHVSKHATIDAGTVVMHHAVVNADAKIGRGCIINTFADVEHDVVVGDFCHISTGVVINGGVLIGEGSFIGSRSVVRQGVSMCGGVLVGAGAVVVSNLTERCLYVGCPAKRIK